MKFNKWFFSALLFSCCMWAVIIFAVISVVGCGNDPDKKTVRKIHGKAAIGAFIDEGAQVQVRPASVDGVSPAELIQGTVGADGNYEIIIPEEIPVIPDEESPQAGGSKTIADGTMEQGTGFIIRVWSASADSWVYSYAENNTADVTANVNPYTDMFVRRFYYTGNNSFGYNAVDINSVFVSGKFSDGTPINIPTLVTVNDCMTIMARLLHRIYGVDNIQNALVDTWQVDLGLDALLTAGGRGRLNEFLQYEFEYLICYPDFITDGYARQNEVGEAVHIEIWTPYGNTGDVITTYNTTSGRQTAIMTKQPDSVDGANHFTCTSGLIQQFTPYACVNVTFVDDNYSAAMAIRVP